MKRKKKYHYFQLLLCIAIILMTTENYLISRNYPLFSVHRNQLNDNDRFQSFLGWTNKPNMKKTVTGEEPVPGQENIDYSGRRYIGKDVENPQKRLLFLGCSYTFGLELLDDETFIYKTSKYFPQWQFDNFAVPGYGTHQCRIMLEKLLERPDCPKYDYVFYVFIDDHPRRVVYNYAYIPDVNNNSLGIMPYADFSWNGKVKYHNHDNMFIPGANIFRTLSFINNLYAARKAADDQKNEFKSNIYNAILEDMLNICKKKSIDFSVLLLDNTNYHINQKLINEGLHVYDIILHEVDEPKYRINSSICHHPNELANEYWADKLREILIEKEKGSPKLTK